MIEENGKVILKKRVKKLKNICKNDDYISTWYCLGKIALIVLPLSIFVGTFMCMEIFLNNFFSLCDKTFSIHYTLTVYIPMFGIPVFIWLLSFFISAVIKNKGKNIFNYIKRELNDFTRHDILAIEIFILLLSSLIGIGVVCHLLL